MNDRPTLLIVSFSEIENDARVKKQLELFARDYRVTSCGRGRAFVDGVEHLEIGRRESKVRRIAQAILLRLHLHGAAFALEPEVRAARRQLRDRRFDVAIANDAESIAVAAGAVGISRTHVDLHEYWPGLHDQIPDWVKVKQPYYRWMMRRYAARAGSATTVSVAIADRYRTEFGFQSGVVRNASKYMPLEPGEVGTPIRLVHSGVAQSNRKLEITMRAVAESTADLTLDLYLTQQTGPYAAELRAFADQLGDRITVHSPVPHAKLVETLNRYDLGIFVLPPTNTNYALALPNKFFDYVQARLGMVIGPSEDMARLLRQYDLGVVASDADTDTVRGVLDGLTAELVRAWKTNAHHAAELLNAEREQGVWVSAMEALAERREG